MYTLSLSHNFYNLFTSGRVERVITSSENMYINQMEIQVCQDEMILHCHKDNSVYMCEESHYTAVSKSTSVELYLRRLLLIRQPKMSFVCSRETPYTPSQLGRKNQVKQMVQGSLSTTCCHLPMSCRGCCTCCRSSSFS